MAFQDPFPGGKSNPLTDHEIVRAVRLDLAGEEEAISTYLAHAEAIRAQDPMTAKVLTLIANEERVHVGELLMLLDIVENNEFDKLFDGMREVIHNTGVGKMPGT
jgi:uncharacterized protein